MIKMIKMMSKKSREKPTQKDKPKNIQNPKCKKSFFKDEGVVKKKRRVFGAPHLCGTLLVERSALFAQKTRIA